MIVATLNEAQMAAARLHAACQVIGVSARTIQRWKRRPDGADRRCGPRHQYESGTDDSCRGRGARSRHHAFCVQPSARIFPLEKRPRPVDVRARPVSDYRRLLIGRHSSESICCPTLP